MNDKEASKENSSSEKPSKEKNTKDLSKTCAICKQASMDIYPINKGRTRYYHCKNCYEAEIIRSTRDFC